MTNRIGRPESAWRALLVYLAVVGVAVLLAALFVLSLTVRSAP